MPKADEYSATLIAKLTEVIDPIVRFEGLILVEVVWRAESQGQALRIYVDRPEGGVTLDQCTQVSREISYNLDVADLIQVAYRLEVSSPGLDRALKTPRDYEIFAGRLAKLVMRTEDGRTDTVIGRLKGMMGDDVILEIKGKVRAYPLAQVAKARLEPELGPRS